MKAGISLPGIESVPNICGPGGKLGSTPPSFHIGAETIPEHKHRHRPMEPTAEMSELDSCENRFGNPIFKAPLDVAFRCTSHPFMWWASPYEPGNCETRTTEIIPPTDYLLVYWMGRYFGFIDESL